jgi:hypothetical protein
MSRSARRVRLTFEVVRVSPPIIGRLRLVGLRRSPPVVSRFRCDSRVSRPMHAGAFPSQHPPPRLHLAFGAPDVERNHPQPVIRANADQRTSHGPVSLGLDPSKSPPPACPRRFTPGTLPDATKRVRDDGQRAFGPWLPSHSVLFRPRGFSPPRRFSPHRGARACCVPVPDMGFAAFHVHQATETEVSRRVAGRLRSRRRGSRPGSSQRRPFEGLILVGSRSASLRSLPPRRLVRPFLPPRTADKEWAAVPTGPRRTRPHGRSLRVQRQRRAAVAGPFADTVSRMSIATRSPRDHAGPDDISPPAAHVPRVATRFAPVDLEALLHRRVRDVGSRFQGATSRSFHGFLIPPRGHARSRWFPRSPASPIPPTLARPKPHRDGVCPRRMSQPSLAADLRGFLTSKNGFDLGSRLVPKNRPPAPK